MTIDVYTATGEKKGKADLPSLLFEVPVKLGLMHQAVMMQQSNRRSPIAHAKSRGEIRGSTRKLYPQKGTGRARRGAIRSNILRGGNKSFGPKSNANFRKSMPKGMRHKALFGSLSYQAKHGAIIGLENYPEVIKTKNAFALLKKLPVEIGRPILIVAPEKHEGLMFSMRNIPRVKTITVNYLNPEDVLRSKYVIFLVDALKKAEEIFLATKRGNVEEVVEVREAREVSQKKPAKKKIKEISKKKPSKTSRASLTSKSFKAS